MTARILVAGIGNIFLGDDGFGSEVARQLVVAAGTEIGCDDVRVVDYGIGGMHLAYDLLEEWDTLVLVDRPHPHWPLPRLSELLYRRTLDRDELQGAQALPLVPSWRKLFERRLQQGDTESWDSRLGGPAR